MTQIYLISPPKIDLGDFSKQLDLALKTKKVPVFQLRLKGYEQSEIIHISEELKKICHDNNCLFFLNDSYQIALEVAADGVHLGVDDDSILLARQESQNLNPNFLIGASCYDSKHLAMEAAEQGADYISFGAFFPSKTKTSRGKPESKILTWCDEILNLPTVAIGGITDENCDILVKAKADFLAVISYVWDHPHGVEKAVNSLDLSMNFINKKPT